MYVFNNYRNREIESLIKAAFDKYTIIILTGPKYTGKTTTIKLLFQYLDYYNLENEDTRGFIDEDYRRFLDYNVEGCHIDELQHMPHLLPILKEEMYRAPEKKYVFTQTTNCQMLQELKDTFPERVKEFHLLPLSFSELKKSVYRKPIDKLLYNGFFADIHNEKDVPEILYPQYVKTIMEQDVRHLLKVHNRIYFHAFVKMCARHIGKPLNVSEMARKAGLSLGTTQAWLDVMEAANIIYYLRPYSEPSLRRLSKRPKIYFYDTGFVCGLLRVRFHTDLEKLGFRDMLFENMVLMELLKQRYNKGKTDNLYYYQDAKKNSINIVCPDDDREGLHLISVESSRSYQKEYETTLRRAKILIKAPIISRSIVYMGTEEHRIGLVKLFNYRNLNKLPMNIPRQ